MSSKFPLISLIGGNPETYRYELSRNSTPLDFLDIHCHDVMEKNSTHPPSQDLDNMTLRSIWEQNTNYNGSSFDTDVRPRSQIPKANANVTSLMGIVHTEFQ